MSPFSTASLTAADTMRFTRLDTLAVAMLVITGFRCHSSDTTAASNASTSSVSHIPTRWRPVRRR